MKKLLSIGLLAFSCVSYSMDQKSGEHKEDHRWDIGEHEKDSESAVYSHFVLVDGKIKNIESVEAILDLRCGSGKLAGMLANLAPESAVIGMDLSKDLIEKANAQVVDSDRIQFLEHDIQNPWNNLPAEFDLIVSFASTHFFKNYDAVLKNVISSLDRNGEFLFTMPAKNNESFLAKAFLSTINDVKWEVFKPILLKNYNKIFTKYELNNELDTAGLWVRSLDEVTHNRVFKEKQKFTAFLESWIKHIIGMHPMDARQQRKFIKSVANKYLEFNPADDSGKITYNLPVLIAHTKKLDFGFLGSV